MRIDYVVGFAFDRDGAVALVRKNRPSWQAGLLNGIGGHVEPDETPIEAMAREFEEETGVETLERDWIPFAVVHTAASRVFMFAATLDPLLPATRTDEEVVVTFWPGPADSVPNLAWLVPMARRACDFRSPVLVHENARYETD